MTKLLLELDKNGVEMRLNKFSNNKKNKNSIGFVSSGNSSDKEDLMTIEYRKKFDTGKVYKRTYKIDMTWVRRGCDLELQMVKRLKDFLTEIDYQLKYN